MPFFTETEKNLKLIFKYRRPQIVQNNYVTKNNNRITKYGDISSDTAGS